MTADGTILGGRDVRPDTGGMPQLHQVAAMGRSRSANHSLTPYHDLLLGEMARGETRLETEADAVVDERPVASTPRRTHAALALAALLCAIAVTWFVRRDAGSAAALTVATATVDEPAPTVPAPQVAQPQLPPTPPPTQQIDSDPIVAQATRKPVTGKPKVPASPTSPRLQQAPTASTAPTVSGGALRARGPRAHQCDEARFDGDDRPVAALSLDPFHGRRQDPGEARGGCRDLATFAG